MAEWLSYNNLIVLIAQEDKIMKKLYKLSMKAAENSTLYVILEDPKINNGYVEGTKVGKLHHIDVNGEMVFEGTEGLHFMAGGGPWALEEYLGDLI